MERHMSLVPADKLLVIGLILVVLTVLLGRDLIPTVRAKMLGVDVDVDVRASRRTTSPGWFSLALLSVMGLAGVVCLGYGVALTVQEGDARASNLDAIERAIAPTPAALPTPALPGSTPVPTNSPIPAQQLFDDAFQADKKGDNEKAIELYLQALDAGLASPRRELAQLEVALLEVLLLKDSQATPNAATRQDRCQVAVAQINAAKASSRSDIQKDVDRGLNELARLC
jgi:hypothetical protein